MFWRVLRVKINTKTLGFSLEHGTVALFSVTHSIGQWIDISVIFRKAFLGSYNAFKNDS